MTFHCFLCSLPLLNPWYPLEMGVLKKGEGKGKQMDLISWWCPLKMGVLKKWKDQGKREGKSTALY